MISQKISPTKHFIYVSLTSQLITLIVIACLSQILSSLKNERDHVYP